EKYVLKIANAGEDLGFLELQNELIRFLAAARIGLEFPRLVTTKKGENIVSIAAADGQNHFVRLLTWLEGECFAEVQPHDRKLLRSLGRGLAQMDQALNGFSHPSAQRKFYWDLRHAAPARDLIELLPAERRPLVERCFAAWDLIDWSSLRFS